MSEVDPRHAHDRAAPWWAATLVVLAVTGLSTNWLDLGSFWRGYVLDMTGPAWTYILVRGLYTGWADNAWTRFFTPGRTVLLLLAGAFAVEGMQFLQWYDSTFDPWDLVAYVSLLVPVYLVDRWWRRQSRSASFSSPGLGPPP